jgi:hypothetical protein
MSFEGNKMEEFWCAKLNSRKEQKSGRDLSSQTRDKFEFSNFVHSIALGL